MVGRAGGRAVRAVRGVGRLAPIQGLRARLLLIVLLAALPAFGLLLLVADEQRDDAIAQAEASLRPLARSAAAEQGREIEATRQLLGFLAQLPQVAGGNPEACGQLLADLRTEYDRYANLGVIEPDGDLVCSAVPPDQPLNLADRSDVQRALESGAFAAGDFQTDRITGEPTISFALPISDTEGQVSELVFATLDLTAVNQENSPADLPEETFLIVVDQNGTVLIRYPNPEEWVGRSLRDVPVIQQILEEETGVTAAPGPDDRPYLYAFALLTGAGTSGAAYLTIAQPEEVVVSGADAAFVRNLQRLGLVGVLALVAAWVGADLFVSRDTETKKALVYEVYKAFSSGSVDDLDEVVAPEFVDRHPVAGQAPGIDGLKQVVAEFRAAFPDGRLEPEELIAEGDLVVARVTLTGTHLGDFFGVAPSGEPVIAEGVETFRFRSGRIIESWSLFGELVPAADGERGGKAVRRPDGVARGGWAGRLWRRVRRQPVQAGQNVS